MSAKAMVRMDCACVTKASRCNFFFLRLQKGGGGSNKTMAYLKREGRGKNAPLVLCCVCVVELFKLCKEGWLSNHKCVCVDAVSLFFVSSSSSVLKIWLISFYQSSPSFSLAGTSMTRGLSMILAVRCPFSTMPMIQAW